MPNNLPYVPQYITVHLGAPDSSAPNVTVPFADYIKNVASSEIYPLLKRQDEKFVTERAYENPKFVEDVIRDIVSKLNENKIINFYEVEMEAFESIHAHNAWAYQKHQK